MLEKLCFMCSCGIQKHGDQRGGHTNISSLLHQFSTLIKPYHLISLKRIYWLNSQGSTLELAPLLHSLCLPPSCNQRQTLFNHSSKKHLASWPSLFRPFHNSASLNYLSAQLHHLIFFSKTSHVFNRGSGRERLFPTLYESWHLLRNTNWKGSQCESLCGLRA